MLIPFWVQWWRETHSLIRSDRSVSSFPWRCSRWSLVWKTGLSISDSCTASSQLLLKHVVNVLMALRVSWGIQLMSTSFIAPVPFSTFRGIRFLCMKHVTRFWLSNIWNLKNLHADENMKKARITHRPGLQDLVHPKQHQNHQATQEDVHEHPTEKQLFKSLKYHCTYTCNQDHATAEVSVSPGVLLVHCPDLCPHRSYEQR